MKCFFGNMESLKLWNFGTLELWNQETKKPTTKKPNTKKPRNFETKKRFLVSNKGPPPYPSPYRLPPLHPTTLLGDTSGGGHDYHLSILVLLVTMSQPEAFVC